ERVQNSETTGFSRVERQFHPKPRVLLAVEWQLTAAPFRYDYRAGRRENHFFHQWPSLSGQHRFPSPCQRYFESHRRFAILSANPNLQLPGNVLLASYLTGPRA